MSNLFKASLIALLSHNLVVVKAQPIKCFTTKEDLIAAVDAYLQDPSPGTPIANEYGWPISQWCVRDIKDFSYLFDAQRNPLAASFNEDLNWCTCSAENMR